MKKTLLAGIVAALPMIATAQAAPDLYNLSQTDLRGTARFMAMGGAFTALGGDLSTLTQNPAGIGVYRRSEIGATIDISPRSITSQSPTDKITNRQTKAYCNNFGYIGTARLDGFMRTFSWGASYNRLSSFDRTYTVYNASANTSLTNYIASYTNTPEADLGFDTGYNPYQDSDIDWLSILAYNSYMINPAPGNSGYRGLYQTGTVADSQSEVRESGYVDEYAIDFGGNLGHVLMWGLGFGITDLNYNLTSVYSESLQDAYIASYNNGMTTGNAGYYLTNYKNVTGTGFNVKFGLIFKPVDMIRIGAAIHTPTWYSLSTSAMAAVDYSYFDPMAATDRDNPLKGSEETDNAYYNFHMNAPWKFMVGGAAVIGSQAIVSLDYEHQAYNDMTSSYQNQWGNYVSDDYVKDDVKAYYKAANIMRMGVEYRATPNFSLRAGYNYASTTAKSEVLDGYEEVYTAGMDPSYVLNKSTNAISLGVGYHYQAFYIDAAYVYRKKDSEYHAFTNYAGIKAPTAKLTETTNNIVLSLGFRF